MQANGLAAVIKFQSVMRSLESSLYIQEGVCSVSKRVLQPPSARLPE